MSRPRRVKLVEVGPRDGLQNEPTPVSVETRIALIDRLSAAGMQAIEAGSFVSPKWVPQMAGSDEVLAGITRQDGTRYPVLVPNLKGLENAIAAGADEIAVFPAATETFSKRNINCSIAESLTRFADISQAARAHGMAVRGYVSCAVDCPFEGPVPPARVAKIARALHEMGCYEISLGDTIGTATADRAVAMLDAVAAELPLDILAGHFHDTYGQALANILALLERGLGIFDCSVAGLGGCPFAPGATGNVASEDVLYMLDGLGIETGVDLARLAEAGQFISAAIGRPPASRAAAALAAKKQASTADTAH